MIERTNIGKKIFNIEYKLILFFSYILFLLFSLIFLHNWSVLAIHISFVFILSVIYFGRDFLVILISPLMPFFILWEQYRVKKYIKPFKQNIPNDVVIVLASSNPTKLEAWIKPNWTLFEIKSLVKYLITKKQNFSFYTHASLEDVEAIMKNKNIKEVYFFGHGSSHTFQLNNDVILYYCEFNNPIYGKEFVHQVHCGTADGKSLVDYVVSEKNKSGCFFFRETITGGFIEKEFNNKTKKLN